MPRNEHLTRIELIDPAIHDRDWTANLIREEKTPGGVDIIDGRPRKRQGRTDYLLCLPVVPGRPPLAVAVLEAKAEDKLASLGIQQARNYAKRFNTPFVFPHLQKIGEHAGGADKQKVIAEIFRNKERTVLTSETNLQDALDRVHTLSEILISDQHMFPMSQALESLLPSLGEKKSDGGQFFTPREIIRVIVQTVAPQLGKTVYDPCAGTCGFLIEAFKHMITKNPAATQIQELKTETLWAREDSPEAIPIALANMVLHGVDLPRLWHGNTLTGAETNGDLFRGAPAQFDYVLTNPPFGSKESKDARARFAFKSGKAQILFLQHIIASLADDGTCGMVIDEGVLFHTKTAAYKQTKRKLLDECKLWCVISLPQGVFVNAGAGVKTDLLFFTKGRATERVWYYDMTLKDDFTPRKVNKSNPLTFADFHDFFSRLALPGDDPGRISERSWYVSIEEIRGKQYDIKATNQNAPDLSDKRTSAELIAIIEEAQKEIVAGLAVLQNEKDKRTGEI